MPSNRTTVVGGIWANGAVDPPETPVQSTTYANSGVTEGEIEAGWPFADIVESAKFNEIMRRLTLLMQLLETWGVLPWHPSTPYGQYALAMGSNGTIYRSKVTPNEGYNPTTSPTQWEVAFELSGVVSTHAGLASPHAGQTPKTLSGATTNTVDATGHTHAISAASETVKGAVELATAAETTTGTDNTRAVHPAGLKVELDKKAPIDDPTFTGVVTFASQVVGGFGAVTTASVADWNDVSNCRSGQGYGLLLGIATNGPGGSGYFHPFTFESGFAKIGTANRTQLAIPYGNAAGETMYMRTSYGGTWSAWHPMAFTDLEQTLHNKTLESPMLTGVPQAPTPAVDTGSTQVATTSFVVNQAASATPLMDGSAAVGTSVRYARGDHRHPTDTTRAAAAISIMAGLGMVGGGDLSTSRTMDLGTPGTCHGLSTNTATADSHTHALSAAAEELAGVVELATAAQTQTGTDNTRAVHPAGLASMFDATGLDNNSGFVRIPDVPGGTIFQGGLSASIAADSNLAIAFPTAFPTALTTIVAVDTVNNNAQENSVKVISVDTVAPYTTFTVQNSAANATTCRWFAIGR